METGQKTIQPNNSKHKDSINTLSIQVSLNGLSFCTLNSQTNSLDYFKDVRFENRITPPQLLDKLVEQFNSDANLQKDFKDIIVVHENELSSLVPKDLFDENHLADYLKFNTKILGTDYITWDAIETNSSVNVYVPFVNINNYLYEHFGEFRFLHFSTVLIEKLLKNHGHVKEDTMFVYVAQGHFEIIVLNSQGLRLYNSFEYKTKEDFIYFILFTMEQLQLDPEFVKLNFMGRIAENDELFNMAFNYVRNVSILTDISKYGIKEAYKSALQNYTLLNSF